MDILSPLPVSLRQLQYLVAVADLGGFRRAAETCHVAQPSLSAQVAQAERDLGVQIFERDRRGVRVTSAGAGLIEQARRVLLAAGDLRELARHAADPFRGTLRIGAIPTVCPYLLPDIAPALARAFPSLAIVWSEERTGRLVEGLQAGALDAAVLAMGVDVAGLEHRVLGRDPFVLAAAPDHPLVRSSKPARPDALAGAAVLLLDDGHCFREQALEVCASAGAGELGYRATSLATLVQMVSGSAHVTLLPSLAVSVENRRGQLRVRPFAKPGPSRTLVLAWRRGSALKEPMGRIAEVVRKAAKLA